MSTYSTLGYVVWGTIAWATGMTAQLRSFRDPRNGKRSWRSPILGIELAATDGQFDQVLGDRDRESNARAVRVNTYMDFVFIFLYSTVFLLLASVVSSTFAPWIRFATLVTAALDILENLSILSETRRVLEGRGKANAPFYFSITKWGTFGLTLVLTGIAMLHDQALAHHAMISVLVLVAGACSLFGVFLRRLINLSVLVLMPALFLIGIFAFRV